MDFPTATLPKNKQVTQRGEGAYSTLTLPHSYPTQEFWVTTHPVSGCPGLEAVKRVLDRFTENDWVISSRPAVERSWVAFRH